MEEAPTPQHAESASGSGPVARAHHKPPARRGLALGRASASGGPESSGRFVDDLVEVVLVADATGRIVFLNQAAESLFGWPRAELIGRAVSDLVPERLRRRHEAAFAEFVASDPPRRGIAPRRVQALRADGTEMPINLGFSLAARPTGERYAMAVIWDLVEQIDIERYRHISDQLLLLLAEARGPAHQMVPSLLQVIAEGLAFDLATVWRWRPETGLLRCDHEWHAFGAGLEPFAQASLGALLGLGEPLPGTVMASDAALFVADLLELSNFRRATAASKAGIHSAFAFPIRARDRLVGVIELFSREPRQPDPPLDDAVAHLGERFGELLERLDLEDERSRLVNELERSRRRQDFLLRATEALAGTSSLEETIRRLALVAVPDLGDLCLIDVLAEDGSMVRLAAQHADPTRQALADELVDHPPDPAGSHPSALAARTGRSQWSPEMPAEFMATTTDSVRHLELTRLLDFTSFVSVPLMAADDVLGALTVVSAGSGRRFGAEELTLAEELAAHVASVVDRARSYDEQREISGALQRSLLPDVAEAETLDIAARYEASNHAADVGGDFYDAMVLADGRTALAIGDVEGHDMEATATMGQVRSAMRAYLETEGEPETVLALLDRFVERQARRLVTLCLAVVYPEATKVTVAAAGHPPPLLASEAGPVTPLSAFPGPPLGIGIARYRATEVTLPAEWALLFYTDGLVEDRVGGPEGRLGDVVAALGRTRRARAGTICNSVLATVTAGATVDDDIAVLAVRHPGRSTRGGRRAKQGR